MHPRPGTLPNSIFGTEGALSMALGSRPMQPPHPSEANDLATRNPMHLGRHCDQRRPAQNQNRDLRFGILVEIRRALRFRNSAPGSRYGVLAGSTRRPLGSPSPCRRRGTGAASSCGRCSRCSSPPAPRAELSAYRNGNRRTRYGGRVRERCRKLAIPPQLAHGNLIWMALPGRPPEFRDRMR